MAGTDCKKIDIDKVKLIDGFVPIGSLTDFADGQGRCFQIGGYKIAVFREEDRFGAIANECIHMGGPLADGNLKDDYIHCPLHGWTFDFETGKGSHRFKGEDVSSFPVKIHGGTVYISLVEKSEEKKIMEDSDKERGYLEEWARGWDEYEEELYTIQHLLIDGKSEISAMGSVKKHPNWDSILFKGGQLHRMPFNDDQEISMKTVIGPNAKSPLVLSIPFYVSHMSFGALSKEAKIALARGTTLVDTAMCSGEGGMLPESRKEAKKYIYELGTAMFSHRDDVIKQADAVEIKIGQAAKPGLGGHLPKDKVTPEIMKIRGLKPGEGSVSPGRHADIQSIDDLKKEVDHLRELIAGGPVGIKFSAGHVEKDIEFALAARPDFITIDTRGGGTGAAPTYIKDNMSMPAIFAIRRARKYLDKMGSTVTLCITGGFRSGSDIAKALALGADAVALATFSLVGIGCQRYRTCHTGNCPVGIATQREDLRARFDIEKSAKRFKRLYDITKKEVENFARTNGRSNVHDLDLSDVFTIDNEVSHNTDIDHA